MAGNKADIIYQLRKEILSLQGFRPASNDSGNTCGLGLIKQAFPNLSFPIGAIHEFFCTTSENATSTCGFISALLSSLIQKGGACIWITSSPKIFPPALKSFDIKPDRILFIHLKKEKEKLWVIEEALKCDSITSVIGEINEISFTESRRLQLAVEQSKVTGFLIRHNPKNLSTACVTRWRIQPLLSDKRKLSGIGFPRWNIELLKVRNGKPGMWQMEWRRKKLNLIEPVSITTAEEQRKIV
jgi:protein ImuA